MQFERSKSSWLGRLLLVAIGAVFCHSSVLAGEATGSYLKAPRIHFSGEFYCDVSTINNDELHYEPEVVRPSPWWNPTGTAATEFRNCKVTSAYGPDGQLVQQSQDDSVVGAKLTSSAAKLVDLDTQQQGISTFFGLTMGIELEDGTSISGPVDPMGLNSLWTPVRATVSYPAGGDTFMSASFQSVMRIAPDQWPKSSSSILQQLRSECDRDASGNLVVLVKFTTDAYTDSYANSNFLRGRVTGTLAAWKQNEPHHAPGQRWLRPRTPPKEPKWDYLTFNGGPFFVDTKRKKLVVDLSNSLPLLKIAGQTANLGRLQAIFGTGDQSVVVGEVDYSEFCHLATGGVTQVDLSHLSDQQMEVVLHQPLTLHSVDFAKMGPTDPDLGTPDVMQEHSSGLDFAVDDRQFRMAHDTSNEDGIAHGTVHDAKARVFVTQWGQPAAGVTINAAASFAPYPPERSKCDPPKRKPPSEKAKKIEAALKVSPSVQSDSNGYATFSLEAVADPGNRSEQLDGQMYFIQVTGPANQASGVKAAMALPQPHGTPTVNTSEPTQPRTISVHMYGDYKVNSSMDPNDWDFERDIRPFFVPYMKLYPAMRERIDLTDENSFLFFSSSPPDGRPAPIPTMMTLPFTSAAYMPVTRDMSPNKIQTVLNFIKAMTPAPKKSQ